MRTALLTLLIVAWATLPAQANTACCVGTTGNLDCDPNNITDITDLTVFIDHLFIGLAPLCCVESGNIDGDPGIVVDITDLTVLIDYLFISLNPTAACLTPVAIVVVPDSGAPGNIVTVTGMVGDTAKLDQYAVAIGAELAPFRILPDGSFEVVLPLYLDSNLWPSPPAGAQSVEFSLNGALIGEAVNALTILPLPRATGSTARVKDLLDSLAVDLQALFASVPVEYAFEPHLRDSVVMLISDLSRIGDSSIATLLDGSSPLWGGDSADLELTDALLYSTGALNYWELYVGQFSSASRRLQEAIASGQESGLLCRDGGPDIQLACKMQLYVILKNFGDEVLAETSREWGALGGSLFSALGYTSIAAEGPLLAAQIVGVALTMADFIVNNQVLSLLPSHLGSLDVNLVSDTIEVDEFTSSKIEIWAENTPETITLNELIDVSLAGLSFLPTNLTQSVRNLLLQLAQAIMDRLRSSLLWLQSTFPELNINLNDPAVYTFPHLTFPPGGPFAPIEVVESDLVRLVTFDDLIIVEDEPMLEWKGIARGSAEIQVQTRGPGVRSKVVNEWFCFCNYTGGAFGETPFFSPRMPVVVGGFGSMKILISGLPDGSIADITVTGTDFNEHITDSVLITDIPTGGYTITAREVTGSDSAIYTAKPETQPVNVTSGDTAEVVVNYGKKFGSLFVVVTGLPQGVDADIAVSGLGYLRQVTTNTILDTLLPGLYTILSNSVLDTGGVRWEPSPSQDTVTVNGGETATVIVDYADTTTILILRANSPFVGVRARVTSGIHVDKDEPPIGGGNPWVDGPCGRGFFWGGGGGVILSDASTSIFASVSGASANAIFSGGKNKVNMSWSATSYPAFSSLFGQARGLANVDESGTFYLDIKNPEFDTLNLIIRWSVSGTADQDTDGIGTSPNNGTWGASLRISGFYECDASINRRGTIYDSGSRSLGFDSTASAGDTTLVITHDKTQLRMRFSNLAAGWGIFLPSFGTTVTYGASTAGSLEFELVKPKP